MSETLPIGHMRQYMADRFRQTLEYYQLNERAINSDPQHRLAFPIAEAKNKGDCLILDEQFLKGHKKVLEAAWYELVERKIDDEGNVTFDPQGYEMAQEIIYYVNRED